MNTTSRSLAAGLATMALAAAVAAPAANAQTSPLSPAAPAQLRMPPDAPAPPAKPHVLKRKHGKHKVKHRRARARMASIANPFRLGTTECLTQPFSGVQTADPTLYAIAGDTGDEQWVYTLPVRFRWNGSAWAYESQGSWRVTLAKGTQPGTSFYDYGTQRWEQPGVSGWSAKPGYYAVAQYIVWKPTKSSAGDNSVYRWTPHTSGAGYCTVR